MKPISGRLGRKPGVSTCIGIEVKAVQLPKGGGGTRDRNRSKKPYCRDQQQPEAVASLGEKRVSGRKKFRNYPPALCRWGY